MTEKYVNRASVCYSLTSSGGCHSFMPRRAPKGKHGQQGHVLSRTVFVTATGLPASVYMANTMEPAGAEGTESGNKVVVKVWFLLCSATDPHGHRVSSLRESWEASTRCHSGKSECLLCSGITDDLWWWDGNVTHSQNKGRLRENNSHQEPQNRKHWVCVCDLSFKQTTALKWTYTFIIRWRCANPWSPWTGTTTCFIS